MRRALGIDLPTLAAVLALGQLLPAAQAQAPTQPQTASTQGTAQTQPAPFKPEELEQIVAPIALYPDALLAQVFMASTYPLEIVQAARWSKEHPEVKGDAVAKEMEKQTWDASVKSLVAFPDVLTMMNEKLDWTQKLGDAFLAQQKDVMDAVQRLRTKAKDAGNLKSSKEQTVKTEPAPAGAPAPQIIIIESPSPEVVYVPTYNPTVVYGAWPYPAYPPYYYYPPAYAPGAAFFSFSMGVVVGGAIWGNCNWGSSDIDIDVNRYNNFNRNEINHNRNTNIRQPRQQQRQVAAQCRSPAGRGLSRYGDPAEVWSRRQPAGTAVTRAISRSRRPGPTADFARGRCQPARPQRQPDRIARCRGISVPGSGRRSDS